MGLIFVTGGARSGKSRYAVERARSCGSKTAFIATAQPNDAEMTARIRRHQEDRPDEWTTIEEPFDVANAIQRAVETGHTLIIVDCLTLLISNLTFQASSHVSTITETREGEILITVREMAQTAARVDATVIVISNELGMGIVPENRLARRFRDVAGRANQILADKADEVYFCVSGVPIRIKGD